MVLEEGRALMIAINKWDVAEDPRACSTASRRARRWPGAGARRAAAGGFGADRQGADTMMLSAAFEICAKAGPRVPTAALNRWFDDALGANPPPAPGGKRIKLRYITQAKTRPPTFVLFGTRLDKLPESYRAIW
jgi:GTP-binding protein